MALPCPSYALRPELVGEGSGGAALSSALHSGQEESAEKPPYDPLAHWKLSERDWAGLCYLLKRTPAVNSLSELDTVLGALAEISRQGSGPGQPALSNDLALAKKLQILLGRYQV